MPTVYSAGQIRYVPPTQTEDMESEAVRARARMPVTAPTRTEKVKEALREIVRLFGVQLGIVPPRTPREAGLAIQSAAPLGMPVYWTQSPQLARDLVRSVLKQPLSEGLMASAVIHDVPASAMKDAIVYVEPFRQQLARSLIEGRIRDIPGQFSTAAHELTHLVQGLRSHPGTEVRTLAYPLSILAHELDAWLAAVRSGLASPRYAASMLGTYINAYVPLPARADIIRELGLAAKPGPIYTNSALLAQALINAATKNPQRVMRTLADLHMKWSIPPGFKEAGYSAADVRGIIQRLGEIPEFPPDVVEALKAIVRRLGEKGATVSGPDVLSTLAGRPVEEILRALVSRIGGGP